MPASGLGTNATESSVPPMQQSSVPFLGSQFMDEDTIKPSEWFPLLFTWMAFGHEKFCTNSIKIKWSLIVPGSSGQQPLKPHFHRQSVCIIKLHPIIIKCIKMENQDFWQVSILLKFELFCLSLLSRGMNTSLVPARPQILLW